MTITKVFTNGNSQAVRLPKGFRFDVTEVEIFHRGDEVVIRKKTENLREAFDLLAGMNDDFFEDGRDDPLPEQREPL